MSMFKELHTPYQPEKTSSTRVLMFAAFGFFAICAIYAALMIGLGRPAVHIGPDGTLTPTWEHYVGFMREVGDGIKWFLGPYVVGRGAKAYEKGKKEEGPDRAGR